MMNNVKKSLPLHYRLAFLVMSGSLSIFSFILFTTSIIELINGMKNHLPVIVFEKTSMYFLGLGISIFLFFILGLCNKKTVLKIEKILIKGAVGGLFIAFTLPHIIDYTVSNFVNRNNYIYCEKASSNSIRYSKYIYTTDVNTCISEIDKKREEDDKYKYHPK